MFEPDAKELQKYLISHDIAINHDYCLSQADLTGQLHAHKIVSSLCISTYSSLLPGASVRQVVHVCNIITANRDKNYNINVGHQDLPAGTLYTHHTL